MSELSSDARALIEAGRFGDEPAGYDKARVRERLVRQLGVGAFAGAGVLTVVRAAGSGAAARPSAASITDAPTLPRGVTPATPAAKAAKLAGSGAGRASGALWVKSLGKMAMVAGAAGALYSGAALLDVLPRRAAPAPTPLPPAEPAPALEPTIEPLVVTEAQPEPAPAGDEARPASSRRARREARGEAPAASGSLAEELALLARAQRMLRDDQPRRALAAVREHGERFPDGALQEERAGIEALARCLLGETDAPSVQAFLERSPSSPLAARVRKECGR